jgi:hypothetical protein
MGDVKKQAAMSKVQQSSGNIGEKVEQGRELHFLIGCLTLI